MLAWRHLMLILFTLSLAGCVTHRDLARNAVSFNLAVEQAQNEMLLLNTVRSSLRRPMYITGIQSVTGSLSTQVSAGLSIPIGKKSETNLSTMGGNYTDHPTFNVAVFETEEFMRGFTAPIAPELLAYYWDQGWSAAFLLHLLVEHVRVTWVAADPTTGHQASRTVVFDNYPDADDPSLCHHVRFALFVEAFVALGADLRIAEEPVTIGPSLGMEEIGGLAPLITTQKEQLTLTPDPVTGKYQLGTKVKKASLSVPSGLRTQLEAIERLPSCQKPATRPVGTPEINGVTDVAVDLFLRSPEAVLYYLGELVRVETDPSGNKMVPTACIKGSIEPIFVARQSAADCRGGALETDYGGRPYFVPERIRGSREQCTPPGAPPGDLKPDLYRPALQGCDGGRSMQALSLASQIISLQKSAKDLPAPSVLRTIN